MSRQTLLPIEQDHRFIERRVKPGLGFASYQTVWRTLQGYEAMSMIRKRQVTGAENQFIAHLFDLTT